MIEIWHGYPRKVVDNMQICMFDMTFNKVRLAIGPKDSLSYDHGYDSKEAAVVAMELQIPGVEPSGWYRCPTDGRRRPDGDISKEYIEP